MRYQCFTYFLFRGRGQDQIEASFIFSDIDLSSQSLSPLAARVTISYPEFFLRYMIRGGVRVGVGRCLIRLVNQGVGKRSPRGGIGHRLTRLLNFPPGRGRGG